MTRWERAHRAQRCGFCGAWITKGQPMFVLVCHSDRVTNELIRCVECAGQPAPTDLPEPEVVSPIPLRFEFKHIRKEYLPHPDD